MRVKCLAQEHNTMSPARPGQGSNPDRSIRGQAHALIKKGLVRLNTFSTIGTNHLNNNCSAVV